MSKLEKAISDLEAAEQEASRLLDMYTDVLARKEPPGTSWGVTRYKLVMAPAGSKMDYLTALKRLRDALLGPNE